MNKYIILFAFLAISINILGQSFLDRQLTLPDPTASAFVKHNFTEPNLYSGKNQFQIPLHNIVLNSYNQTIGLSYSYGGLKVSEVPSNVGLGWSLNFGGQITLIPSGLPDDTPGVGYNHLRNILGMPDPVNEQNEYASWLVNMSEDTKRKIADAYYDLKPDHFYLSAGNLNTKVMLLNNGEYFPMDYSALKITRENDLWIVLDENGTKYVFGKYDNNETIGVESNFIDAVVNGNATSSNPYSYYSVWFLREIETKTGDKITYDYELESYDHPVTNSHTLYHNYSSLSSCQTMYNAPINTQVSNFTTSSHRIKEINYRGGKISFLFNTNRNDVGANILKRLDSIVISDYEGSRIKKFKFDYDYLGNNDRLLLTSLIEFGSSDSYKYPAYVFQYFQGNNLPDYSSFGQDHWGYYNGQDGNSSLVPRHIITSPNNAQFSVGGIRKPDFEKAKIGALTSIKSPLGSTTTFSYQPHDYGSVNSGLLPHDYHDLIESYTDAYSDFDSNNNSIKTDFFMLPSGVHTVDITWEIDHDRMIDDDDIPYVKLYNIVNSQEQIFFESYNKTQGSISKVLSGEQGYFVEAGTFEETDRSEIRVSHVKSEYGLKTKSKRAGGIRLKQIEEKDNDLVLSVKKFKYTMEDEPDRSSGVIINEPIYEYPVNANSIIKIQTSPGVFTQWVGPPCSIIARTAHSLTNLNAIDGHIGYRNVTVSEGINENFGFEINKFSSAYDFPDTGCLGCPSISYGSKRGKLVEKSSFDNEGDIVSKIEYEYFNNIAEPESINEGVASILRINYIENDPNDNVDVFEEPHSGIWRAHWPYLKKETSYYFNQLNNTDTLETTKTYHYDNPIHAQITRQSVTGSSNIKKWIYTLYPDDYDTSGSDNVSALSSSHISNALIEKIEYTEEVNNSYFNITGSSLLTYRHEKGLISKSYQSNLDQIKPVESFKVSNKYDIGYFFPGEGNLIPFDIQSIDLSYDISLPQTEINLHDTYGNVLEYKKSDGITNSVIWGYDYKYPVFIAQNCHWTTINAQFVSAMRTVFNENVLENANDLINEYLYNLDYSVSSNRDLINVLMTQITQSADCSNSKFYTYKPLVGRTSVTDQNLNSEFYKYDQLSRLKQIFDENGNITRSLNYNYKED